MDSVLEYQGQRQLIHHRIILAPLLEQLLKVNKTVGTFAAWHGGLVASNVFLEALDGSLVDSNGKPVLSIDAKEQLGSLVAKCDSFTARLNAQLAEASLPIRLRNFANTL